MNRDSEEFSHKLEHALGVEPKPMTAELQRRLTWEDATERFLDVAELKASERPGVLETAVDKLAWVAHNTLTGTPAALTACNDCKNGPSFFKLDTLHLYTPSCQTACPSTAPCCSPAFLLHLVKTVCAVLVTWRHRQQKMVLCAPAYVVCWVFHIKFRSCIDGSALAHLK